MSGHSQQLVSLANQILKTSAGGIHMPPSTKAKGTTNPVTGQGMNVLKPQTSQTSLQASQPAPAAPALQSAPSAGITPTASSKLAMQMMIDRFLTKKAAPKRPDVYITHLGNQYRTQALPYIIKTQAARITGGKSYQPFTMHFDSPENKGRFMALAGVKRAAARSNKLTVTPELFLKLARGVDCLSKHTGGKKGKSKKYKRAYTVPPQFKSASSARKFGMGMAICEHALPPNETFHKVASDLNIPVEYVKQAYFKKQSAGGWVKPVLAALGLGAGLPLAWRGAKGVAGDIAEGMGYQKPNKWGPYGGGPRGKGGPPFRTYDMSRMGGFSPRQLNFWQNLMGQESARTKQLSQMMQGIAGAYRPAPAPF